MQQLNNILISNPMKPTYLTKIPKLATSIKDWLFADLKQSIALADQHDLFGDLNISNLKITKPPTNQIYPNFIKTLAKIFLLPTIIMAIDCVTCAIWIFITGHDVSTITWLPLSLFVMLIGIFFYGFVVALMLSKIIWTYNLLLLAVFPNLKYGNTIAFIMRSYFMFSIKIFSTIIYILSLISTLFYYTPTTSLFFIPIIIITTIVIHSIFQMELERVGLKTVFNNLVLLLNKTSDN